MAHTDHTSTDSREVIEKRGGHTSGSEPYVTLPEVSNRPAVGADTPTPTTTTNPAPDSQPQPAE